MKEHAAWLLRVLQFLGISVVFPQPSDFSSSAYETDWLAQPSDHCASFFTIRVSELRKFSFFPIFIFIFPKLCKPDADGPLPDFKYSSQTHWKLCYRYELPTDCESDQDFIEGAENEANINKKKCEHLFHV